MSRSNSHAPYFYRTKSKISGVCAYLADKMDWDVTVIRLVTLLGFFVAPVFSVVSYFITAWLIPKRSS